MSCNCKNCNTFSRELVRSSFLGTLDRGDGQIVQVTEQMINNFVQMTITGEIEDDIAWSIYKMFSNEAQKIIAKKLELK